MFYYIKTTLRERWPLFLVVLIILSAIGLGYMGAQSVTERITIQAKTDLDENWRYPYDLLVLPNKPDISLDLDEDLVPPQSTIANYGGISKDDLKLIQNIDGVEIAAPLSLIGYIQAESFFTSYAGAEMENFYETRKIITTNDGLSEYTLSDNSSLSDYNTGSEPSSNSIYPLLSNKLKQERDGRIDTLPPYSFLRGSNEFLLVAIDPIEENRLFTFTDSLISGNYFNSAPVKKMDTFNGRIIPIVALANQQAVMNETVIISKIELPENTNETDYANGIERYLKTLPKTEAVNVTIPTSSEEWKYKQVHVVTLTGADKFTETPHFGSITDGASLFRYSPLHFHSSQNKNGNIPVVKAEVFEKSNSFQPDMSSPIPRYRTVVEDRTAHEFGYNVIGMYDSTKVLPVLETNWKIGDPVDIYTPPTSRILEDGAGNPVSDKYLLPLPYKDSYYTGAPDAITTMGAANKFYKKDPITSIRVVVKDVAERTDASQRIIEDVAKRIIDETGHHVEIMLGSAATKVHVDLGNNEAGKPGVLEEGWQTSGVSWSIEEQIEKSNVVLFIYLLLISFVFCYTVITHSLLRRSTEFAMLRAIGWSRRKIVGSLIFEIIVLSLLALIPILIANARLNILGWYQIVYVFLIILPVIGIGYFTGSRKALKLSPRAGLEGEGTQWKFMRLFSIKGLNTYVIHQLMRRPLRFGLLSIVLALTSFMVILFIATQKSLSEFLLLSFLGETIDLNLKGFQTAFLVVGISLTISIVFLLLYLNITERKGEFFTLRAIGWSLHRIQLYMGIEVLFIAILGSCIGGTGAYLLLTYYSTISLPMWLIVVIILTPPILMLIFSMTIVQSMKIKRVVI